VLIIRDGIFLYLHTLIYYRALGSTSCEMQWLLYLMKDLHIQHNKVSLIYCDNLNAIHIVVNREFRKRTKHLEIDCHIVRERVLAGTLKLLPVSSKDQVANLFTKSLLPQPFNNLLSKLGMIIIYQPPTCGGYYTRKCQPIEKRHLLLVVQVTNV
jgi:hypothetical protein